MLSPLLTLIAVTTPSCSALMLFSIFIASRTATVCPAFTWSPTLTLRSSITPGSGDRIGLPVPADCAAGAGVAGCSTGVGCATGAGAGA